MVNCKREGIISLSIIIIVELVIKKKKIPPANRRCAMSKAMALRNCKQDGKTGPPGPAYRSRLQTTVLMHVGRLACMGRKWKRPNYYRPCMDKRDERKRTLLTEADD